MLTAKRVIALLGLEPLPIEGGYFRQSYRASEQIGRAGLPPRYEGPRAFGSAIYYLLTTDTFSALHRLRSDEIYHFALGRPVEMLLLHPDGRDEVVTLGPDLEAGQRVQVVVPHGVWQGSRLAPAGDSETRDSQTGDSETAASEDFALLGTTMAPAYDQEDFELGGREELLSRYPASAELIRALTR